MEFSKVSIYIRGKIIHIGIGFSVKVIGFQMLSRSKLLYNHVQPSSWTWQNTNEVYSVNFGCIGDECYVIIKWRWQIHISEYGQMTDLCIVNTSILPSKYKTRKLVSCRLVPFALTHWGRKNNAISQTFSNAFFWRYMNSYWYFAEIYS